MKNKKIIGYIIETSFGIITKLEHKGRLEFFHSSSNQGIYLFKTKKEANKIRNRFKQRFNYTTKIHKVF